MQPSWEAEFDALLASTSKRTAGPSNSASRDSADTDSVAKLQELFSLSASHILERKGLDSVRACLNNLAANGRLDNATITRASSMLERTREYFGIFERAFLAEDDWKTATAMQEVLRPKVEALITKKEQLADLDRQIVELQNRRSVFASELAKEFESGKPCLIEYATNGKRVEQLKLDKKIRQAEVTKGEVRWLELKAFLGSVLPSSP